MVDSPNTLPPDVGSLIQSSGFAVLATTHCRTKDSHQDIDSRKVSIETAVTAWRHTTCWVI